MVGNRLDDDFAGCFIIVPAVCWDNLACRSVDDLPPAFGGINRVHFELLCMKAFHQRNAERFTSCRDTVADQIFLLDFLWMLHCPVIVLAGGVVCRVDFGVLTQQFFRHGGSVAVPQGICAQQIFQAYGLVNHVHICRQGEPACIFCIHCGTPPYSIYSGLNY